MKIDKSLKEVWQWKAKAYEETKKMKGEEFIEYIRRKTEKFRKKHFFNLKTS